MAADALPQLSEDDVAAFRRDGAVCLRGVFEPHWLEILVAGVERELAHPGPLASIYTAEGEPGRFFGNLVMWRRVPEFEDFVRHSPAAAIAGACMGAGEVIFYHDQLLVKEPGTGETTPWHHDQPYYPVDGEQVISIWLPLDPVPRETCMELVAGSHRWGKWFAPRYFINGRDYYEPAGTRFERVPDIDGHRGDYRILGWDLAPGDCIVFHALTLHGAPGNRSLDCRRRAYATRWLGEDARYAERPGLISPPIEGHGLEPGDPMDCDTFPVVWRAGADKDLPR